MRSDLEVMVNPDFLALGLGGTSMMAMLWTVASGRRAVGVELRGDPFLGVHWNIREDLYHHLGLIDRMMLERYGEDRPAPRQHGPVAPGRGLLQPLHDRRRHRRRHGH